MDSIELSLTVELEHRDIDVTAVFEYEGGYDGIGHYEFWGQKCFQLGEWNIEGVWYKTFETDETLTPEEKHQVEVWLEAYAEGDAINDKIYDSLAE